MIDECKRILECINSVVYVFEQSSGRLVFANQAARELIGLEGEAYIGRNHTEFFEESVNSTGQDALGDVSDDGSGHVAQPADEPGGASDRAVYNGRMLVRSTGIGMDVVSTTFAEDDICYRIVVAEDSRSTLDQRQALEQIVKNELVVTEALSVAMEQEDPDEAIDSLLRELGKGFKADRSYIFEANEQGGFDNTYEWCREGVVPEIENLQNVSEQILVPWNNAFDEQGYLFIRDLDAYQSVDPDVYAVLQPQQIHSLVVAPLTTLTTKRVGFFGVDNPDIKMLENNEAILSVLGHFISSLIAHRNIIERLQYVSERDDLTQAYNRTSARRLLDVIEDAEAYNMMVLDIDHFRDINEMYGAQFGDYVLQQFASRLNDYLKDYPAFLARYGSDEFLVALRGRRLTANDPFVMNLRRAVHVPVEIGMSTVTPTISIGITYSEQGVTAQEKVAEATRALHEAKKLGRGNTAVFTDQMRREMEDEVNVKIKVSRAMKNDGFYMVYQPKVAVDTLEVIGYEALVRMKGSSVSPAFFVPIALENGWLREIGRITTEKTISEMGKWLEEGFDVKPVSINFSSVQVLDAGYFDFLMEMLDKYHVSPELIQIEITEQVMMEFSERALNLMDRFDKAGIKLLLDDFGTGYSSLSYINKMPLDVIKLDKSFADDILADDKSSKMVKDIVLMGHDQGMRIIAEGAETKEQFTFMKDINVDAIQGFFFSKPLMPDEAVRYANEHRAKKEFAAV